MLLDLRRCGRRARFDDRRVTTRRSGGMSVSVSISQVLELNCFQLASKETPYERDK